MRPFARWHQCASAPRTVATRCRAHSTLRSGRSVAETGSRRERQGVDRIFDGPDGEPIYAAFDRIKDDVQGLEWITGWRFRARTSHAWRDRRTCSAPRSRRWSPRYSATLIGNVGSSTAVSDLKRITDAARSVGDGDSKHLVGGDTS